MNSEPSVTVIIPAYNEEAGITALLQDLAAVLREAALRHEIIVVDDGSTDHTAENAGKFPAVKVIRHKCNRGYGAALKTGIRHANYGLICITDADGTYPSKMIPNLVAYLVQNECDMVVGSRTGDKVHRAICRRPAKWLIAKLADHVAGEHISDVNSGLRAFRRDVALNFLGLLPDGFSFTTTITLATLINGYIVDYIPIDYFERIGKSKIRPFHDTANFIRLILRIALYFAPLKIFLPTSLFLFLLAIIWTLVSVFCLGRLADMSALIIIMAAIQVAVMGLIAEIIDKRVQNQYRKDHGQG